MNTITIKAPKGLKSILINILEPIKTNVNDTENKYVSEFEFIGTNDNPVKKIKEYGKGIYESITILSID